MYIGVVHTITDQKTWGAKLKEFEAATLPDGFSNPITFISADTDYAFCLWDAPSVSALQPMLDGLTEGATSNMYFPVDPKAFGTSGIPVIDLEQKTKVTRS